MIMEFRRLYEGPLGFVLGSDDTPDAAPSPASTRDGPIMLFWSPGSIHQLSWTKARFSFRSRLKDRVPWRACPETPVRRGSEVTVTAVPSGRFSVFDHWSDGSVDSPDPPHRSGPVSGRLVHHADTGSQRHRSRIGPMGGGGRTLLFSIVGDAQGYRYALEQSQDLQNWSPCPNCPWCSSGNAWGSLEQFDCYSDKAQLSVPVSSQPISSGRDCCLNRSNRSR